MSLEDHHILPKSKNLFPEYSDLKIFKWNSILLTYRQHYIAHWILSKIFTDVRQKSSMLKAFSLMAVSSPSHSTSRKLTSKELERCVLANRTSMKINNPMHNPEIVERARLSMQLYYSIPDNIEKIRNRRLGVNNITEKGRQKLSELWLGVKRPKSQTHIENARISASIGLWITPFGEFYNPTHAEKSINNTLKLSRHLIKKYCLLNENGFEFIPKTQK